MKGTIEDLKAHFKDHRPHLVWANGGMVVGSPDGIAYEEVRPLFDALYFSELVVLEKAQTSATRHKHIDLPERPLMRLIRDAETLYEEGLWSRSKLRSYVNPLIERESE